MQEKYSQRLLKDLKIPFRLSELIKRDVLLEKWYLRIIYYNVEQILLGS